MLFSGKLFAGKEFIGKLFGRVISRIKGGDDDVDHKHKKDKLRDRQIKEDEEILSVLMNAVTKGLL